MPETHRRPMPNWSMDGVPNIRPVHWLTFDACRGVLFCKDTRIDIEELLCVIVHATAVHVHSDQGGTVLCASNDREKSNFGSPGRRCPTCEFFKGACRLRWRIWMQEVEGGTVYAHTLSVTASANFVKYANCLQERGHLPGEVVTDVFVEDFVRKRSGLSFRRLQFECASDRPMT